MLDIQEVREAEGGWFESYLMLARLRLQLKRNGNTLHMHKTQTLGEVSWGILVHKLYGEWTIGKRKRKISLRWNDEIRELIQK